MNTAARPSLPIDTADARACAALIAGLPLTNAHEAHRLLTTLLTGLSHRPPAAAAYLDVLDTAWPPDQEPPITFVVIPEYVARHWWERILYNQAAKRLRTVLLGRPRTVVVNVPYRREDPNMFEDGRGQE